MKKRLLGFLICAMLVSMCVGCDGESTATEQTEAAATTTTEDTALEPATEMTAAPKETEAPHTHNYAEEITTDVTCEVDGLKTFTCECGDTYTEMVPATGHVFENYISNNDATYLADGTETAKCNTCDWTDTRTAEGSKLEYTYTEMNATMYATQTVNVRNLPSADGEKIGSLSTNQEITVVGQCVETDWYKFELDGQTAFVSNSYLSTEEVAVQQSTGGGNVPANVPNALTVERGVIHDMGTYRFVIAPWRGRGREGNNVLTNTWGMHLNTSEDLWAWVEYSDPNDAALAAFIKANGCHCGNPDHNGLYPERLGN